MIGIETYAYCNRWRNIHPRDKMMFALATMLLCLFSHWVIPPLIILLTMGVLTTARAKVPGRFYLKLFLILAGSIVIGAIAVGFTVSPTRFNSLWEVKIASYHLGFTQAGLNYAVLLLLRSLGATSCLLFLALTTPLEDITHQLERWKVPYIMIEMMTLIYRFIFVFWEQAVTIHTAQAARLGHVDIKTSLRSLGYLISSLFINVMDRAQVLYWALIARGYTDSLRVLEEEYEPAPLPLKIGLICFDVLILGLIMYKRGV